VLLGGAQASPSAASNINNGPPNTPFAASRHHPFTDECTPLVLAVVLLAA
jgi:hypothetical protein